MENKITSAISDSTRENGGSQYPSRLRVGTRIFLYFFLAVLVCSLGCFVFTLTRQPNTIIAFFSPDHSFEQEVSSAAPLNEKKDQILRNLNEELTQEKPNKEPEESRLLSRLDRLWQSLQDYVTFSRKNENISSDSAARKSSEHGGLTQGDMLPNNSQEVLYDVLALSSDEKVIRNASLKTTPASNLLEKSIQSSVQGGKGNTTGIAGVMDQLQPLEGPRTRGLIVRLHPNLSFEGTLDTATEGEIDPELQNFSFRSLHALTFLQDQPQLANMTGLHNMDSDYPRGYGLGLNLRLSSTLFMLFDYSHEFTDDYFFEYRGDWQSSPMADYTGQAENTSSTHSFFFGLHYLLREKMAVFPLHTGFFYSTNMCDEPLLSDVSMGFSLGGGYRKKDIQLGVSYRLRIWDNPEELILAEIEQDLNKRMSNQILFVLSF